MVGNGSNRPVTRRGISTQRLIWIVLAALAISACIAFRFYRGANSAQAITPIFKKTDGDAKTLDAANSKPPTSDSTKPLVVAIVNGESIARDELARETLRQFGKEVLEGLTNKYLIEEQCKKQKITVTQQEIDGEIDHMARKFALTKDQWMKLLQKERNVNPAMYGQDVVWPTLALRKLAAAKLTVTREELGKGFESQFGEAIKARLIVTKSLKKAQAIRKEALAKPDEFGLLAKKFSEDVNSASANGMIQPIRRHLGDPKLEEAAFSLKPGEISQVVPVGNLYALLKCEGRLPPIEADHAEVDPLLIDAIRDRKLAAANDMLRQFQEDAKRDEAVVNVYNDPKKSQQMPGVAAMIYQRKVTIRELAEACIDRHGNEVLEGILNRRLLEQALRKRNMKVSRTDIDAEVARAALSMGKTKPSGEPDVDAWLDTVAKEQKTPIDLYIQNAVWPSVALKKLIGSVVKVTDEDLKRGYEANYGPRVRCRAIIMSNQRKAQEVWEKARDNPSVKNFGDLAEQFSVENNNRQLRGEVPPIQRWGGQPILEKEAFVLKPGEISGVIQVGENFVILLCEGYTKPMNIKFSEVKQVIYDDLLEKKERIAMARQFELIKDGAQLDNYLAGIVQTPKKPDKPGGDDLDKELNEPEEARAPGRTHAQK